MPRIQTKVRGFRYVVANVLVLDRWPIVPANRTIHRSSARGEAYGDEAARETTEGNPLTLITIGAITTAEIAFREFPNEMAGIARVVAMASNFHGYEKENACGEHNVTCDPAAFQAVLDSGVEVVLVGLNVTRETARSVSDLAQIAGIGGPLAESLAEMHREWFDFIARDFSPMHDALAVAAAFDESLMSFTPMRAYVALDTSEPGALEFNPVGQGEVTRLRVATAVDSEAFHCLFFARIQQVVAQCR